MNIGIVGSRRRNTQADLQLVEQKFLDIYRNGDMIISGGCPEGADRFAEWIAKKHQIPITIIYAQWKRMGVRAGYVRNGEIAAKSDTLIACVAPDRKGGTEDTIKKFKGELILV